MPALYQDGESHPQLPLGKAVVHVDRPRCDDSHAEYLPGRASRAAPRPGVATIVAKTYSPISSIEIGVRDWTFFFKKCRPSEPIAAFVRLQGVCT
jgi:hypothetical protein